MAYNIRIRAKDHVDEFRLLSLLTAAGFTIGEPSRNERGKARRPAWASGLDCLTVIQLRNIRLAQSRPYCGNHAGPCDANNPHARFNKDGSKPKSKCLEGSDWIRVHNIVNDWLDSIPDSASEVFTEMGATDGKMYVRREGKRRQRWDYIEIERERGVPLRPWISGKPGGGIIHDFQFTGPRRDSDYCLIQAEEVRGRPSWQSWEDEQDAIQRAIDAG